MKIEIQKKNNTYILTEKLNQHGLIAGATGTGKTVTLKVLCEELSKLGVPTILSDVKGDLSNLCKIGKMNKNIEERLKELEKNDFQFENFPVTLWDVYGELGLPLRVSISEMGPILLSQILDLNDVQKGILSIAFRVADEEGFLLIDIKDLRSMLNFLNDNKEKFSATYGNITSQSIASIQRKILMIEDAGAYSFFGEPSIEINDLIRTEDKKGVINILSSKKLINNPTIYSMFLLWLLSELFETLPEVGNLELPKLVFFFDEAHLLFNNLDKNLLEKIEQVVRLIRSKGVGIFFITQNPLDISDKVASQLGNKIVHQLRAFSPKELKAIKIISETFRENPDLNISEEIVNLRTGEALMSFLDENGVPSITKKSLIPPPHSSFDVLTKEETDYVIKNSSLYSKYKDSLDRISAFEILKEKLDKEAKEKLTEENRLKEEKERKKFERDRLIEEKNSRRQKNYLDKSIDSMLNSITRTIGRELVRSILGSLKKKIGRLINLLIFF